jgi:hypothetical protein
MKLYKKQKKMHFFKKLFTFAQIKLSNNIVHIF